MTTHGPPSEEYCRTGSVDRTLLEESQRAITRVAAQLASFCEHVEHNESNSVEEAARAGDRLREIAAELSARSGLSLTNAYAARIRAVEEQSLLRHVSLFDDTTDLRGANALDSAKTWDEVQICQIMHDRQFHPDVFGLPKLEQIRHYTFHVTKLAGLLVDAIDDDNWPLFQQERLADIAIFGVKIATVCNRTLPSEGVDT